MAQFLPFTLLCHTPRSANTLTHVHTFSLIELVILCLSIKIYIRWLRTSHLRTGVNVRLLIFYHLLFIYEVSFKTDTRNISVASSIISKFFQLYEQQQRFVQCTNCLKKADKIIQIVLFVFAFPTLTKEYVFL